MLTKHSKHLESDVMWCIYPSYPGFRGTSKQVHPYKFMPQRFNQSYACRRNGTMLRDMHVVTQHLGHGSHVLYMYGLHSPLALWAAPSGSWGCIFHTVLTAMLYLLMDAPPMPIVCTEHTHY